MIGVDTNSDIITPGLDLSTKLAASGGRPIDFLIGSGEDLCRLVAAASENEQNRSIQTNSVDAAMVMYTLYHMDIDKTLGEVIRATKPGGRVAISTSSYLNKSGQRAFEAAITGYINDALGTVNPGQHIPPPQRFTAPFDKEQAPAILSRYPLKPVTTLRQRCDMVIYDDDSFDDYLGSLAAMWPHFESQAHCHPGLTYNLFHQAITATVVPKMLAQIEQYGSFVDHIERITYICENIKDRVVPTA
jgi:SAM-dependent methyltransferase